MDGGGWRRVPLRDVWDKVLKTPVWQRIDKRTVSGDV